MSEIKHYSAYQVHTNHPHADDSYVHVADHDAIVADKDKTIARGRASVQPQSAEEKDK